MINLKSKEMLKLRLKLDKYFLGLYHAIGPFSCARSERNELWLTDGIVAVISSEIDTPFDLNKIPYIEAIEEFIEIGETNYFNSEAHVDYYKDSGGRLAAILKDARGNSLWVNNDYLKLFGEKFKYFLYVPKDEDLFQTPFVVVKHFDDLVGIILPIRKPN